MNSLSGPATVIFVNLETWGWTDSIHDFIVPFADENIPNDSPEFRIIRHRIIGQ